MLLDIILKAGIYLIIFIFLFWPYLYCIYKHYEEEYEPSIFSLQFWKPFKIFMFFLVFFHTLTMFFPSLLFRANIHRHLDLPSEKLLALSTGAAADAFIAFPLWFACASIFPHIVQKIHSPIFNKRFFFSQALYSYAGGVFCTLLVALWWVKILH